MRIDAHENADKVRLRREPGGALRSNFKPSSGQYALNGKSREAYISGLERQRDQLFSTGDKDGAKRYAIQAEFERASQVADNHQRLADASKVQAFNDDHERRAQEARAQMTQTQLKMAELDKRTHSEWESTAQIRTDHYFTEAELRNAEERKLAEQLSAERNKEDYQARVEAREQNYRERIAPEHQKDYDSLVDDVRRRFANTHGKDPDTYAMSDRERELSHKFIVDQGYGQDMRSQENRIHEVNSQESQPSQHDAPRLDPKRFIAETDRAADESPRNDQYLRQPASDEQAQRRELVESELLREAGYKVERHADHIAYSRDDAEKPAVRDYGHRISADPKQMQSEEARRDVISMVAERFPNGFEIRTAHEERKQEYAREAVRQGLGDRVKNPELLEFIKDYKQQYAEEQRAQRNDQPQREANAQAEARAERQAEAPGERPIQAEGPVQERAQVPEMPQRDAGRLERREQQRQDAQLKLDVLSNQSNLTDTQSEAFRAGLDASRGTNDPQLRREQEMEAHRQADDGLKANEQLARRAEQPRSEPAREAPQEAPAQRNDQPEVDWGQHASDPTDWQVREMQRERALQEQAAAQSINNPMLGPTPLPPTQPPDRAEEVQEHAGQEEVQSEAQGETESETESEVEREEEAEGAEGHGELDLSHLPEDMREQVREQVRESMEREAQLAAQLEAQRQEQETQRQSNFQSQ
ncbi:hypothetical protein [Scleromatobacter humisilvae]|uniref:Uncharacterized protein n=1 Tax=Scleromatobacter humisilvae TaxID=2897159 RepID=A0A9X2C184_9BURK|nr:hypothetical protein [Scleromatobacter humisilvae]MCK9687301.1 hypothetical protein [Scleromatobacter humisilvae]